MIHNNNINKEVFLSVISNSKNSDEAAKTLNISKRTLFRYKNKFMSNEDVLQLTVLVKDIPPDSFKIVKKTKTHYVIPDCQVKPGVDVSYLGWIGKHICELKPDRIICIGDFGDMPCLYNYKKDSFDARVYKAEVQSVIDAMEILMVPIRLEMKRCPSWKPTFDLTRGNHEKRIDTAKKNDNKIGAFIGPEDLGYEKAGWTVHEYLKPVILDGIAYAHYFTSTLMGNPVVSAKNLLDKKHMSCVMGHRQDWEMARQTRADGIAILGLMVGACYLHDEDYLGPQGNNYSRQVWILEDIENGSFEPKRVDLKQLKVKYGDN